MSHLAALSEEIAARPDMDVLDASALAMAGPLSMVELGLAVARRRRAGLPTLVFQPPDDEGAAAFLREIGFARLLAGEDDPTRRRADTLELRQMTSHDRLYTERVGEVLV
jgi:hypothetical protein